MHYLIFTLKSCYLNILFTQCVSYFVYFLYNKHLQLKFLYKEVQFETLNLFLNIRTELSRRRFWWPIDLLFQNISLPITLRTIPERLFKLQCVSEEQNKMMYVEEFETAIKYRDNFIHWLYLQTDGLSSISKQSTAITQFFVNNTHQHQFSNYCRTIYKNFFCRF